ncbi:MAG TPA: DNA methyltransferase [Longimicrobium sp.]|jgi:hypothetical protein
MSRVVRAHADWRTLLEPTEPFLTLPVLKRVFPDGLPPAPAATRAEARSRLKAVRLGEPEEQWAWVEWVLRDLLAFKQRLKAGDAIPSELSHAVPERGVVLRPDFVVVGPRAPGEAAGDSPRLIVRVVPLGEPIAERTSGDGWAATHVERVRLLCRARGCEVGVVTDGDRWVLVWAPEKETGGHATFAASLFAPEPAVLDAFMALLGARRFFGVARGDHLEALFHESSGAEEEVTTRLGEQVRGAVELLVAALARADRDSRGELLKEVEPAQVYDAALTVLMRLVFLFAAEERGLLPLGDEFYDGGYAVSPLREQLREDASVLGEEALEHRHSAWHRILALVRAVHGGIGFDDLRIPAYGGGLFDPDRFAFLEGRGADDSWTDVPSTPVPIDDRTVLEILQGLQVLTFQRAGVKEARTLSYRSLSVEQIGHVYEGLLDHSVVRAEDVVGGLIGPRGAEPEIALAELEDAWDRGAGEYVRLVAERTGKTEKQIKKLLEAARDENRVRLLRSAAENQPAVFERILPHLAVLRDDERSLPVVFLPGMLYVTATTARRDSGTAYTTRDLANEVAEHTLQPLVYSPGPAEERDPGKWRLRPAAEILALRVCDPAIGSGAIIVAACRYMADRVVEAWAEERRGGGEPRLNGIPVWTDDAEELGLVARRAVADRCLYGVDRNPMAVEMAKMSLWLITMARERPFTFLDHAFKVGDSLLGVSSLDQLLHFHMDPGAGEELHGQGIVFAGEFLADALRPAIAKAVELRTELEHTTANTLRDVEEKEAKNDAARDALADARLVGDALVGAALANTSSAKLDARLTELAPYVTALFAADRQAARDHLVAAAQRDLNTGKPGLAPARTPFHWPIEFPEVVAHGSGFDAMLGNPPFLGGQRITGAMGTDFRDYLVRWIAEGRKGSADLSAYFFLRSSQLTQQFGFLATNTIAQGDTRAVGLDAITTGKWSIYRAVRSVPWPGSASLEVSKVWASLRQWTGAIVLDGVESPTGVSPMLLPRRRVQGAPHRLRENASQCFQGSIVLGMGFVLNPHEANHFLELEPRNRDVIFPYPNGEDLNNRPDHSASRFVINFRDWPEHVAASYNLCFERVERQVKPERAKNNRRVYAERWWQHAERRADLYRAITPLKRVLAITLVSKTVMPAFVSAKQVFANLIAVYSYDDDAHFGLLSSSFHWWWAVTHASTLETRIRYTPTDCFETLPQPQMTPALDLAGRVLNEHREALMVRRQIGLTDTYNLVHNSKCEDQEVLQLRALHVRLDDAVRGAYAASDPGYKWAALDLEHGFYETTQGMKFTIGPAARAEILDRLLELNFERHAAEVAEESATGKPRKAQRARPTSQTALGI